MSRTPVRFGSTASTSARHNAEMGLSGAAHPAERKNLDDLTIGELTFIAEQSGDREILRLLPQINKKIRNVVMDIGSLNTTGRPAIFGHIEKMHKWETIGKPDVRVDRINGGRIATATLTAHAAEMQRTWHAVWDEGTEQGVEYQVQIQTPTRRVYLAQEEWTDEDWERLERLAELLPVAVLREGQEKKAREEYIRAEQARGYDPDLLTWRNAWRSKKHGISFKEAFEDGY